MEIDLSALDAVLAVGQGTPAGSPLMVAIDLIDEDAAQPRTEFSEEALRELAATIAERGVRQPISLRSHPTTPGRWLVNFGARRLRASRIAGRTDIPAFVDESADTYDQVIENEQREALQPLELALFVGRRLKAGDSQAEIARRLGKSRMYVTYLTCLIDAPEWLLTLYRQGRCRGIAELYELARLDAETGPALQEWLEGLSTVTRGDIKAFKQARAALQASDSASMSMDRFSVAEGLPQTVTLTPIASAEAPVVEGLTPATPAHADHAHSPRAHGRRGAAAGVAAVALGRTMKDAPVCSTRIIARWGEQDVEIVRDVLAPDVGMFAIRERRAASRNGLVWVGADELTLVRIEPVP